jgi:ABC-2 type transport system ATP-binding protein
VAEGPPGELGAGGARYLVSYETNGRRVHHDTDDPTDLLHRLTSDALAHGERLDGLTVSRPTLEDVYLDLTRDEEALAGGANGALTPADGGGRRARRRRRT